VLLADDIYKDVIYLVNSVSCVAKREMAAAAVGATTQGAYRQTVEGEEPVHVVDGEVGCQWNKSIVLLHLMAMKKKREITTHTYIR
jgi:hypothetical protein